MIDLALQKRSKLIDDIEKGISLPSSWYTDPSMLLKEQEKIFRRYWQYIGRTAQLANVGDFITGYIGDIPIAVIRNENGIEGFVNVCRHRRYEVVQGDCGNAKILQCKYHAWTYDLEGNLKAAPRAEREPKFCKEELGLLKVNIATWGPWVFVNPSDKPQPFEEYLGDLPAIIKRSGIDLDMMEFHGREQWTADANWKVMLENYLECYHCAVAHPGFSAVINVDPEEYHPVPKGFTCSQSAPIREGLTAAAAKKAGYDATTGLRESQYHFLWPNLTININPGHANLSIDIWMPETMTTTKGFSEQYFGKGVPEQWKTDLIEFNRQVGLEDDTLTNSVQRGLNSGLPDRGRFMTDSEVLVMHFQKLLVNALSPD
jgi:phenylpropionate dioxygenase-like ring-hydroxylating dioxygenase large terminal subunit